MDTAPVHQDAIVGERHATGRQQIARQTNVVEQQAASVAQVLLDLSEPLLRTVARRHFRVNVQREPDHDTGDDHRDHQLDEREAALAMAEHMKAKLGNGYEAV